MSNSFATSWITAHQVPLPWDFTGTGSGFITGVGCPFLFQGIFPTQGLNTCLYLADIFFTAEPLGKPVPDLC